jgi:hypothetical protein
MKNSVHTVFLRGGLGNQFFQWVYALSIQERGNSVSLDDSFVRPIVGIQAKGTVELKNVFFNLNMPVTNRLRYLKRAEPLLVRLAHSVGVLHMEGRPEVWPGKARLHYGYYQRQLECTEAVRQLVQGCLRLEFYPKAHPAFPNSLRTKKYAAVHIRGGDYKQAGYNSNELGLLAPPYYALALASPDIAQLPLVVVSDDNSRARRLIESLITPSQKVHYLSDLSTNASDSMLALSVMLSADGLICANSSFSAMAGYLNPKASIICPSPWFRGSSLKDISPTKPKWQHLASAFETPIE